MELLQIFLKSKNVTVIVGRLTKKLNEVFNESLFTNYQKILIVKMNGSDFVFDFDDKLYYKLQKIALNFEGLYINSKKWLTIKKQQKTLKSKMKNVSNMLY